MRIRRKDQIKEMCIFTLVSMFLVVVIVLIQRTKDVAFSSKPASIIENVTKPLFRPFKSSKHLIFKTEMVEEKHPTTYPVEYSIRGESICSQGSFNMLILIPSTGKHGYRRYAIRQTWASMVYQSLKNGYQIQKVRLAFFIGDALLSNKEKNMLQEEATFFNDMVICNFRDTYKNLSLKIAHAISWAHLYCGDAKFFVKVDDDVFLNIDLLSHILTLIPNTSLDFNLGFRNTFDMPPVLREGRWSNDVSVYPFPYYPPYVIGYAYVLSRIAVQKVAKNLHRFRVIANEDAFINGVIAQSLNITRIHSDAFSSPIEIYTSCDVVFNRYLAFVVDSTEILPLLWESYSSNTCSNQDYF